jgi:hypothetical protein
MTNELSEEMNKIFEHIEEERQRQSRFIKLQSGETRTLQFIPSPNNIEVTEDEFEGSKYKRVHYFVIDPNMPMGGEKILPMSLNNAISINAFLKKGLSLLEVKRMGSGRNTKYTFAPG